MRKPRSQSGSTTVDTLAVPFITWPLARFGGLARRILDVFRGGDHDARCDLGAVGITRYPPGLSAAIEKMTANGTPYVGGSSSVAHLWAVGPDPDGEAPGRYGVNERLELLSEL